MVQAKIPCLGLELSPPQLLQETSFLFKLNLMQTTFLCVIPLVTANRAGGKIYDKTNAFVYFHSQKREKEPCKNTRKVD